MAQTRRRLPVVTFAVALAAIGLAFREWYAFDPEPLRMSYRAFAEQPWRLVSPVLLHADILPLILSVYWLVGTLIAIIQQYVTNQTAFGKEMRAVMEKRARKAADKK